MTKRHCGATSVRYLPEAATDAPPRPVAQSGLQDGGAAADSAAARGPPPQWVMSPRCPFHDHVCGQRPPASFLPSRAPQSPPWRCALRSSARPPPAEGNVKTVGSCGPCWRRAPSPPLPPRPRARGHPAQRFGWTAFGGARTSPAAATGSAALSPEATFIAVVHAALPIVRCLAFLPLPRMASFAATCVFWGSSCGVDASVALRVCDDGRALAHRPARSPAPGQCNGNAGGYGETTASSTPPAHCNNGDGKATLPPDLWRRCGGASRGHVCALARRSTATMRRSGSVPSSRVVRQLGRPPWL